MINLQPQVSMQVPLQMSVPNQTFFQVPEQLSESNTSNSGYNQLIYNQNQLNEFN